MMASLSLIQSRGVPTRTLLKNFTCWRGEDDNYFYHLWVRGSGGLAKLQLQNYNNLVCGERRSYMGNKSAFKTPRLCRYCKKLFILCLRRSSFGGLRSCSLAVVVKSSFRLWLLATFNEKFSFALKFFFVYVRMEGVI